MTDAATMSAVCNSFEDIWEIIALLDEQGIENCYQQALFHRISGDKALDDLSVSSKLNSEWPFLCHLFEQGREAAEKWLATHFDALGHVSTLDIDAVYLHE